MPRWSAAPLIFDPLDWEQLTPAFGRLRSMVGVNGPKLIANNLTANCFDRYVHEGRLELVLVALDGTYRRFDDDEERRKLHICAPLNYQEGCTIEPYYAGYWYVRRSDLDKLTTIPPLAVRTEAELVSVRTPQAERQPQQPPPAAHNVDVSAPVTNATSSPAEGCPPPAREAAVVPPSDAEVGPEGSPSATGQTVAEPAPVNRDGRPTDAPRIADEARRPPSPTPKKRSRKQMTRGGAQTEPAPRVEMPELVLPVEPPPNASAAAKIAWAYCCLRIEAPEKLRLRGDALRRAVFERIAPSFASSRSSWKRAMAKVRDLDRQAALGKQD